MYTWTDEALKRLRVTFAWCDQFLPVRVLELLTEIPEGDENALFDLSRHWRRGGTQFQLLADRLQIELDQLRQTWAGDAGDRVATTLNRHIARLRLCAQACNGKADQVHDAANAVE